MTASERTTWANLREARFRHGINKTSLDIIESAAFVLVLDDMEYNYDEVRQFLRIPNDFNNNQYSVHALHPNISTLYFRMIRKS